MLVMLAPAGTAGFGYVLPISIVIVCLLTMVVTISYEQTIHAYPGGGGAYIVARDNLGYLPALAAGAALFTDYILTVACLSFASGVAQIISAYPNLFPFRVSISVVGVFLIMMVNLRGVKKEGAAFAVPSLFLYRHDGYYNWIGYFVL